MDEPFFRVPVQQFVREHETLVGLMNSLLEKDSLIAKQGEYISRLEATIKEFSPNGEQAEVNAPVAEAEGEGVPEGEG